MRISSRVKQILKQSSAIVRLHNWVLRLSGGKTPNHEIIRRLRLYAPNSAGALKIRSSMALDAARNIFPILCRFMESTGIEVKGAEECPFVGSLASGKEVEQCAGIFGKSFDENGSDKRQLNYHYLYGAILCGRLDEEIKLLEIGLGTNNSEVVSHMGRHGVPGASVRAFRDCLKNASIFGADVDKGILFNEERIKTCYVDQTDLATFAVLESMESGFDIIIDDGLHSPDANLNVLIFALKMLRKEGFLIIEDIAGPALPFWMVMKELLPAHFSADIFTVGEGEFVVVVTDNQSWKDERAKARGGINLANG